MATFSLEGKVALVTGASRGLGATIARVLASLGAKVVVNYYQSAEMADEVVRSIRAKGGEAEAVQANILDESACKKLVGCACDLYGKVDIMVLNATPTQTMLPMESYDAEHYRSMLDAFVMSPFYLSKAALAGMKERKFGRIINITSEVIDNGVTDYSAYVAAKGGQNSWTHTMARELGEYGVTVNNVAPGWIPVERHEEEAEEAMEGYRQGVPMKRMGSPEDVAHAVAFFASNEASFISGQKLSVNGANTVG
ncbi:SDR family NAD(P)-dependent oxidoreductase [Rubritalea tangerina]|uniref:SDR family NAD(P)-dependent oxidoreductase n=1 Tax=Rubritalea tangerina TaxID=430798 RepID=A0ABW4Z9C7_9BACT